MRRPALRRLALLAAPVLLVAALLRPGGAAADSLPAPVVSASPPWVAEVVGRYAGTVRNSGAMECHRTEFSVADGHLVGHYWIDDTDPFDGTLTDFVPESDSSGHFTWTDRYGSGVEFLMFSSDRSRFSGLWGDRAVDPHNVVFGVRGDRCPGSAVSLRAPPPPPLATEQAMPRHG